MGWRITLIYNINDVNKMYVNSDVKQKQQIHKNVNKQSRQRK